ncbi:MAG: hypothetical protein PVF17_00725 [Ignavibacteria bacterium]|jgi:HK97 gp10 family phage protein
MPVTIKKFGNPLNAIENGIIEGNAVIAAKVTAQTKVLAPVAQRFGGTLRNSYMWRTSREEGGFNDSSGGQARRKISLNPSKFQAYVGSALDYAIYQEFGTRKMAPQPHIRPAIAIVVKGQNVKKVIKKVQEEEMKGALKKGVSRVVF